MQINIGLTSLDLVQMRQILHNSGVPVGKCFRLMGAVFQSHERNTLAQYHLTFADATQATIEVYFDTIGLRMKADVVDGAL